MDKKSILLAYATRFGSTQEVAETIAASLHQAGFESELRPMQEVQKLNGYGAVVLGAAIYNAHLHQDAHKFLSQYQETLRQLPVAIFTLGPLSPSEAAKRNSRRQLDVELAKYPWLKPVAVEIFAGKYDPSKPGLRFIERLLPARDYRNWDAIRAWAYALSTELQHAEMVQPA